MPVNKPAVAELIAYGVADSQIGEAFGVTPQHIANLKRDDEELKELIQEKATDIAVRQHNNSVTEEKIEAAMLTKIEAQIDLSDSLIETVKSLQLLKDIQAKGRAAAHGQSAETPTNLILNMGDATEVKIQRSGSNEIISIAGRDMAPMPAKRIIEAVKEKGNGTTKDSNGRPAERYDGRTTYGESIGELNTDSL